MDEQTLLLEEYKMLKEEINQKIGYQNTLLTFTDTAVVSIVALITAIENPLPPEVYLVPLIIIVPMMFRVAYYRSSVAKIAAYISVFLEPKLFPIQWESKQFLIDLYGSAAKEKDKKKFGTLFDIFDADSDELFFRGTQPYYDFIILAIICYGIFCAQMINTMPFNIINTVRCLWVLPLEIAIILLANRILNLSKSRVLWKTFWQDIEKN